MRALGLCLLLLTTARTAEPSPLPATSPPDIVAVSLFDPVKGLVVFLDHEMVPRTEKRKVRVTTGLDGLPRYEERKFVVADPVPRIVTVRVRVTTGLDDLPREVEQDVTTWQRVPRERENPLANYTIRTAAGAELTPEQVAVRLRQTPLVFLCRDKAGLDPVYLKLLAKDALVFIPRKSDR